jgi:hypothetical protein
MLLVITVALVTRAVLWLVAMVLGTLLAVAALITVTAGIGARRPAAEGHRYPTIISRSLTRTPVK